MSGPGQRRFPRIAFHEKATVYDQQGRVLGIVIQVSGGGMKIAPGSADAAQRMAEGTRHSLTVAEAHGGARETVDVIVRYSGADAVGVEFVPKSDS